MFEKLLAVCIVKLCDYWSCYPNQLIHPNQPLTHSLHHNSANIINYHCSGGISHCNQNFKAAGL